MKRFIIHARTSAEIKANSLKEALQIFNEQSTPIESLIVVNNMGEVVYSEFSDGQEIEFFKQI